MGIFGKSRREKLLEQQSHDLKALRERMQAIQSQNLQSLNSLVKSVAVYPKWDTKHINDRYCTTDDLYSIIRRLAVTSAMIPMYPYLEKNEAARKQLKKFQPSGKPYHQKALMLKALEDMPETDPLYELLDNPSDTLSPFEFREAAYSMLYLHGECIIWKERASAGLRVNKRTGKEPPRKLHILFPQFVVQNVSQEWPQSITSYQYLVDGQNVMEKMYEGGNIPPEDVIHIKYFNPNFSISGTELRGLSPLRVLSRRMTRMDKELNVSVSQMDNGGVNTIVYMEDLVEDDAQEVLDKYKDNFYRYTANKQNTGSVFWANGKMEAIPLGLKLADMEVSALEKIDFKKLCNAYGISDILFNNGDASTESNVKEMRKALYTDAALHNVFRLADALESGLKDEFEGKIAIVADVSEIPELQDDQAALATWLSVAWWVSPNEKRSMQKFDKHENPIFDEPLLPTGLMTIDDLLATEELPNPANDYLDEPK